MKQQKADFGQIFIEESARSGWKQKSDPQALFKALGETMENTRVRAAGACFGSQLRTDVCNALFREAAAGVELMAAAVLGMRTEDAQPAGGAKAEAAAPMEQEKKGADYVQPALIAVGFMICALSMDIRITKLATLALPFAALLLGVALVREAKRFYEQADLPALVRRIVRRKQLANAIIAALKLDRKAQKPEAKPEVKAEAKAAPQRRIVLDAEEIERLCLRQMSLIEENLPVFEEAPEKPDDALVLWPLVRTILQKKYADEVAFPEEVEDELKRYFRTNGLTVREYSEEHAALFKTQPMNETFTIFPAVVGKDGRILEYGQACVKEE